MLGRIYRGPAIPKTLDHQPDFCVVGSGAGGSVAAATLAQSGATVLILEDGGHHTRAEFNMQESWAYPTLYQDHGNRTTDDLSIMVLQGRSVGGGTTINWTSSFRTPATTLRLWSGKHQVDVDAARLEPHFQAVEARLSIPPQGHRDDVNKNNGVLWDGARKLGWKPELIRRNVKGCARLGYCGMGCPLDAKQSSLVTYVPDAIQSGATLYANCRADRLVAENGKIQAVLAHVRDEKTDRPTDRTLEIRPKRGVVLAGGAINTPALLLASDLQSQNGLTGRRTFLHPTIPIVGLFKKRIEGFYGAPQSVSCQQFVDRWPKMGYLLEVSPIHPMLAAIAFPGLGDSHRELAEKLPFAQATIALVIDGHGDDPGGDVSISSNGRIRLSYPFSPGLKEAAVDAISNMAKMLFAAGAREVVTLHQEPQRIRSEAELYRLAKQPFGPNLHTVFSAHQMGGAAMGEDPAASVVNSRGRHHDYPNLWITDGSVFPSSVGANPQLSIFAFARMFASEIASGG